MDIRRVLRNHIGAAVRVTVALLLSLALLATGRVTHTPAHASATYRNPVFARDFPDPSVLKVGGDYYAYGTTTDWQPLNHLFPILHSRDLVHWRYVGDAMTDTPAWSVGDWWAPDVIAAHGRYYMYFVGKGLQSNTHCIGVATAARPTGPFQDRGIIGCGDASGQGYIDPAPLIDTNDKAYLYLSVDDPYHSISVIPLQPNLLRAAGPRKELFPVSQLWERGVNFTTVEGPFPLKRGHNYDVFYSGNDWQRDYAMGYAVARSPLGPFAKYQGNPILRETTKVWGPGGGSVVQGPHGGWWLVYHAWSGQPGYGAGSVRNLRIDPLTWKGNVVSVRGPTTGVEPVP